MRVWPAFVVLALSGLLVALALGLPLKAASVGVVPALVDGLVLLAVLRADPANRSAWRRPAVEDRDESAPVGVPANLGSVESSPQGVTS